MNAAAQRIALGALLPLTLVVAWQVLGVAQDQARLPLPSKVISEAVTMIASGDLPAAIGTSLARVFTGFAIAAALAIPIGLAMGSSRAIERNLDPLVESFRPIAAIAILPLAILWFGTGTPAALMIVAYAAFFPIVVNTIAGAKRVNPTLLAAASTMGLSRLATIRTVTAAVSRPATRAGPRPGSTTSTSTPTTRATASGPRSSSSSPRPARTGSACGSSSPTSRPARSTAGTGASSSSAPTARPTRSMRRTSVWRGPAPTRWRSCAA